MYSPAKSNPNDLSFAYIREENLPPSRRSTDAEVVCQSAEAVFQTMMSSGVVYALQTSTKGAETTYETMIFMWTPKLAGALCGAQRNVGCTDGMHLVTLD